MRFTPAHSQSSGMLTTLAGMNAMAVLTVGTTENVLWLPAEALAEQGFKTVVYTGYDAKTGELIHDATCCSMCRRMVINAGISRVVARDTESDYTVVDVEDWVREDDTIPMGGESK